MACSTWGRLSPVQCRTISDTAVNLDKVDLHAMLRACQVWRHYVEGQKSWNFPITVEFGKYHKCILLLRGLVRPSQLCHLLSPNQDFVHIPVPCKPDLVEPCVLERQRRSYSISGTRARWSVVRGMVVQSNLLDDEKTAWMFWARIRGFETHHNASIKAPGTLPTTF